jgi:hypothetical protein
MHGSRTIHHTLQEAIRPNADEHKPKVQYCHVHAKKHMIACQCIQAERIHDQMQTANDYIQDGKAIANLPEALHLKLTIHE